MRIDHSELVVVVDLECPECGTTMRLGLNGAYSVTCLGAVCEAEVRLPEVVAILVRDEEQK